MGRRGLTLIELLVVIVLLLILTAVALPVLNGNSESRRVREAARLVSTYISTVRNRAIETGRPAGFQIEPLPSNPSAAMVLSTIEVPPIYGGDVANSICTVFWDVNTSPAKLKAKFPAGQFNETLVRVGDSFKANYQGHAYTIVGPAASPTNPQLAAGTTVVELTVPAGTATPWPSSLDETHVAVFDTVSSTWSSSAILLQAVPWQIARGPVRSSSTPIQLPEGAVIDLSLSGQGSSYGATGTIGFLFSPGGQLLPMTYVNGAQQPIPTGAIHLFVGASDGVMPASATGLESAAFPDKKVPWNLRNLGNLWVSFGGAGQVSTTENAAIADTDVDFASEMPPAIANARAIAQSMQSMGGR